MNKFPLTVKRSIELAGIAILGLIIIHFHNIIMPMLLALVISIVLLPVYKFFKKRKFPSFLAIIMAILLLILIIGVIIFFISSQIAPLVENFAQIKENILNHMHSLSGWFTEKTSISTVQQTEIVNKQVKGFVDSAGSFLTGAAASVGSVIAFFGMFLIYTFLILFYKDILRKFVFHWFSPADYPLVEDTIQQVRTTLKSYVVGLLIQITYLTILLGGALMLFGIKHAFLIGVIFGILNLIPYVGALVGILIGVLLTLSSSPDPGPVVTVLIAIAVVQFLDNNILMPGIVGSKIRINALASLAGLFLGGAIAGIAGMFLSLPIIAILKIIFDHSKEFKQWGILFGDERPKQQKMGDRLKARTRRKKV